MFTLSLLNVATHPESHNCLIDRSNHVLRRQASDWNDAGLRGCHATDVSELYVDGIGIGIDAVAQAVGIGKWPLHPVLDIVC